MATLLLPGMPGGPHAAVADRAASVAGHPWRWRAGWGGWQVTAASDLLLAVALVTTPWVPRTPAILALLATVAALVPDQYGQAEWTWRGVALARRGPAVYAAFEPWVMRLVAGWGAVFYLSAALCWTGAFAAAGTWSRRLTWLSVATWSLFAATTVALFWPTQPRWLTAATSAGSAVAFVLLLAWLTSVTEQVLRRSRPTTPHGQWAAWRHPGAGWLARACDVIANSRLVRAVGGWVPFVALASDVTDAVYVNYLVAADRLAPLVPAGLTLRRVGGDRAVFTILTYRHGHFGPRVLGRLRRWVCPSPVQSNWRVYVTHPAGGETGVLFVTTAIDATVGAVVARAVDDNVPMHVPAAAVVEPRAGGGVGVWLDPGPGSAPDLSADLSPVTTDPLPAAWLGAFGDWAGLVAAVVPQDRAFAPRPWDGLVVRQDIALSVPVDSCRRLAGPVVSAAAASVVGDAVPVCIGVDRVGFAYRGRRALVTSRP